MNLVRITQSSAAIVMESGGKKYQILFSFDFPAGIAVNSDYAVLGKAHRKLKTTAQHIEKWLPKGTVARELSPDDLADGIIQTMRLLYAPPTPHA